MTDTQSEENKDGVTQQGSDLPDIKVEELMEGESTGRMEIEERSSDLEQPSDATVTDSSTQNIDNAESRMAAEAEPSNAESSSEASDGTMEEEPRRGRSREPRRGRSRGPRPSQVTEERVPAGRIVNRHLLGVFGRSRSRSDRENKSKIRRPSPFTEAMSGSGIPAKAKKSIYNVIPSPTIPNTTDSSSGSSVTPVAKEDKGKQRARSLDRGTQKRPIRGRTQDSMDITTPQRGIAPSSTSSDSPSESTRVSPSDSDPSNSGSSSPAPSNPRAEQLKRRHSSAPLISLHQARDILLQSMADDKKLPQAQRARIKNYPFSVQSAQAYGEFKTAVSMLKDMTAKRDWYRMALYHCDKERSSFEKNVEQLQSELENEIEEKYKILDGEKRKRDNVAHASVQTETEIEPSRSGSESLTEVGIVANILAKHRNRLAAAQPSTDSVVYMYATRGVDWSRMAPANWSEQGARLRRHLDSNFSGGGGGSTRSNAPSYSPRRPRFTFEMQRQHEISCRN